MRHRWMCLLWLALAAAPLPAQEAVSAPVPSEVLLFKSGQAFLRRILPLKASTTEAHLELPTGAHGTLWLGSASHFVLAARTRRATLRISGDVRGLTDMLRLARDREVTLDLSAGTGLEALRGRLTLLEDERILPAGALSVPPTLSAVVVHNDNGVQVVPVGRVLGLHLDLGWLPPEPWRYQALVQRPVLDVDLRPAREDEAPGSRPALFLSSMAAGLAWAPSYVLTLLGEDRARLVGKAVVINDLEDLEDTRLRLAVGFPSLRFAQVPSALLPGVSLQQLVRSLSSAGRDSISAGVLSQRAVSQIQALGYMGEAAAGPAVPVPGQASEDLYVFDLGTLTLARGERAYLPLLEQEVSFSHRFDWNLPDRVDEYSRFQQGGDAEPPPVWHVLRLVNGGTVPWTTAPVLVMSADQGPLAQAEMAYTPAGESRVVRLTQALDLMPEAREWRAPGESGDRKDVRLFGSHYERITVKGQLALTNRSNRATPLRVRKRLSGELVSAEGGPEVKGGEEGLGRVNAGRTLVWTFQLSPGERWRAAYEYQVLIRR